jgi:hypothetical protein
MNLIPLGRIVRLQLQRSKLKLGEKPNRVYDPAPLLAVDELTLTSGGALARLPAGATLLDVHHAAHPATRNNGGHNDLSVGFTSHYAAMRAEYGQHLADGCAGENLLVEVSETVSLERVAGGLVIQPAAGGEPLRLNNVRVDLPCVEFSRYASRTTEAEAIKRALQFLDHGRRGYYCTYEASQPAVVAVGDEVFTLGA